MKPIFGFSESGTAGRVGLVIGDVRKENRELVFGDGVRSAVFIVGDRNRTAPVALARDKPVAHAVRNFFLSGERVGDMSDFNDREGELFGKLAVAVVFGRNGHNSAGAVARENVVGDPDGEFFASDGIFGVGASKDAGFFFVFLAFDFGFFKRRFDVIFDSGFGVWGGEGFSEGVFRGKNKESCAFDGVGTGGKNGDFLGFGDGKVDFCAFGAANPVSLGGFDFFRPIERVYVF